MGNTLKPGQEVRIKSSERLEEHIKMKGFELVLPASNRRIVSGLFGVKCINPLVDAMCLATHKVQSRTETYATIFGSINLTGEFRFVDLHDYKPFNLINQTVTIYLNIEQNNLVVINESGATPPEQQPTTLPTFSQELTQQGVGYYCLNNKGTHPPRVAHATYEIALQEAQRLSTDVVPGSNTLVLQPVALVRTSNPRTTYDVAVLEAQQFEHYCDIEKHLDLPF